MKIFYRIGAVVLFVTALLELLISLTGWFVTVPPVSARHQHYMAAVLSVIVGAWMWSMADA